MNRICRELTQIPESSRALSLLLTFSAILMGALFIVRWNADLNFDGEIYIAAARKFGVGMYREGLAIYPMPLFPYLISLIHKIIPNWVLAGRLISYFSMTLTVIPLYLLGKDLFNRRAAFWGCIAFALLPETLLHSNSVMRDPPFFLFAMCAVYFSQKALQSKRLVQLVGSALFAWVSTLFRIEGLIIFPAYFCFLFVLAISKSDQRKDYIRLMATWGGLFACLIAAIYIGMESRGEMINRFDDWALFFRGFRDLSFLENYHRVSAQLQQMQDASVNSIVGQHFAETAMQFMELIYLLGMLHMFSKVILAVNIIPLLWGLFRARYTGRHVFVLLLTCCFLVLTYGFLIWHDLVLARYLFMPAVLLCPWVGFGIDRILVLAQGCSHKEVIVACVLLLVFAAPALKFDKYFTHKDDLKSRAGSWIAKHEGLRNLKIIFSDPGVKFHAGMKMGFCCEENKRLHQDPSDRNFSKIAQEALKKETDVIVIYSRTDRRKDIADFAGYKEIKEFNDKNKFIKISVSVDRLPSLLF
ncbi:MAG: glycosyltransferase family 39 protein [Deltaproteobacteria bacterium]|nr:glycosyltransferase family 39 protein [Deltaproteobacteria bacterium]